MGAQVSEGRTPSHITATTTITTKGADLLGIFVASASATPTIAVSDGAGNVVVNTFTPTAATWYPLPFIIPGGLIVTISGTVDCTVAWSSLG